MNQPTNQVSLVIGREFGFCIHFMAFFVANDLGFSVLVVSRYYQFKVVVTDQNNGLLFKNELNIDQELLLAQAMVAYQDLSVCLSYHSENEYRSV